MKRETPIKAYVINLKKRVDRKLSILSEFKSREEFELTIYPGVEHREGAVGLWETIMRIVQIEKNGNSDYILLCEDDHVFTDNYSKEKLLTAISQVKDKKADVLLGGVSWFDSTLQVDENLFWVDKFNGLQFTVIFRKFYSRLLEADFKTGDSADFKVSELSDSIFVSFPFISVQKEFGYSDVTTRNEKPDRISALFQNRTEKYKQLKAISKFYGLQFDKAAVDLP